MQTDFTQSHSEGEKEWVSLGAKKFWFYAKSTLALIVFSITLSKPKWIDQYHPLSQHYHWKRTMVKFLVVMRWCWSFFDVMLCRYFEKVVKWILSNRTSVLFRERLPSCQWNPQSHILVLVPKGLFQTSTSSTGCLWWISSLSSCPSLPGPAFPSSKPQWLIMLASSIATWGDLVNILSQIDTSLTFFPSAFQRGVWSSIRLCTSRY